MNTKAIIRRIAACLRITEDPSASPNEKETAARQAEVLKVKAGIKTKEAPPSPPLRLRLGGDYYLGYPDIYDADAHWLLTTKNPGRDHHGKLYQRTTYTPLLTKLVNYNPRRFTTMEEAMNFRHEAMERGDSTDGGRDAKDWHIYQNLFGKFCQIAER